MDIDQTRVRRVPIAPDLLKQQLSGKYLPRFPCKGNEEVELQRGQGDAFVSPAHCMAGHVNGDIGDPERFRRLLVARVRARLRRGEDAAPEMLTIGPPGNQITIDVPAHTVTRDGEEVKLTPLEFDLLVALARKPWQVFTREVLLERVWGYRHAADTRLVNVHVQRLRSKIEADPERPEIVVTVRGVGYKAGATSR